LGSPSQNHNHPFCESLFNKLSHLRVRVRVRVRVVSCSFAERKKNRPSDPIREWLKLSPTPDKLLALSHFASEERFRGVVLEECLLEEERVACSELRRAPIMSSVVQACDCKNPRV
jgi:hypothetical protein